MVLPQDWLLQFVRVMGSVLFVLGLTIFIVCAIQIYTKVPEKGTVLGGLYSYTGILNISHWRLPDSGLRSSGRGY
jgi:hypothetical protein